MSRTNLAGIVLAAVLTCARVSAAPGDLNCDGAVDNFDINPFVLALTNADAYVATYPACNLANADCNEDGVVDNFDINAFVALLVNRPPHLGEYGHGDCQRRSDGDGWCPDDVVELTVQGNTLHTLHQNAEYNCCPDDIVVSLTVEGNVLRLDETEILSNPCFCICCYDVEATVVDLAPGLYTVQYCWYEYGEVECRVEEIEIP